MDIVDRLIEAVETELDARWKGNSLVEPIVATDRLAALLRERIAAGDACSEVALYAAGGVEWDHPTLERHRAAVEACRAEEER